MYNANGQKKSLVEQILAREEYLNKADHDRLNEKISLLDNHFRGWEICSWSSLIAFAASIFLCIAYLTLAAYIAKLPLKIPLWAVIILLWIYFIVNIWISFRAWLHFRNISKGPINDLQNLLESVNHRAPKQTIERDT